MMEEVWKDIKGFEGRYQVSNLGRVKSLSTSYYRDYPYKKNVLVCYWPEKIQAVEHTGKVRLRTIKGDIDGRFDVGHLVAKHFVEGYKEGMEVIHKDGNIMNSQVGNLHVFMPETIDSEEWKDIKGFEGRYQISNMGRVRSMDRWTNHEHPRFLKGRMLNPSMNKGKGYLRISLSDGSRNYTHYEVHRLVALHFVPGYKEGLVVNHKNEIKTDNRAENLEFCTQAYNLAYSDVVGYKRRTVYKYDLDGNFIAKYKCLADAEKEMGLSLGRLVHALYESKIGYSHGFRWSFHFTPKEKWAKLANKYKSTYRRIGQYDLNGNFIAKYESIKDAAEKYGVSQTAICNCCHNKSKTSAGYIWKYMPF